MQITQATHVDERKTHLYVFSDMRRKNIRRHMLEE